MKKIVLIFVCCLTIFHHVRGQAVADTIYAEPVIKDSATFIQASLMIGEPSHLQAQSVFGHAFLRMQCPSENLDYCYSMESGNYENFLDICLGNYPNRLACVPTDEYLSIFEKEGRIVTEYPLNLRLEESQSLWQLLDATAAQGISPYHDFFHHGCSQEIVSLLTSKLQGKLVYGSRAESYGRTILVLGNQSLPSNSWMHLPPTMLGTTDFSDRILSLEEKTLIPWIVPDLFSDATIVGDDGISRPILKDVTPIEHHPKVHFSENTAPPIVVWFLAMLCVVVVICLVRVCWSVKPVVWLTHLIDLLLFLLYNAIAFTMLFFSLRSSLPSISGWNWNFLFYNPVPLLLWLYHLCHPSVSHIYYKYIGYTVWAVLFMMGMAIVGDHLILEQYLLVSTFAVRCLFKGLEIRYKSK
ncbi:MAG: DUF4105 domain-containing protein [Bacteroidaceae bacterium]|nr:DUF4105 domain-containing protein [Bacteroidaceae bacterium]